MINASQQIMSMVMTTIRASGVTRHPKSHCVELDRDIRRNKFWSGLLAVAVVLRKKLVVGAVERLSSAP